MAIGDPHTACPELAKPCQEGLRVQVVVPAGSDDDEIAGPNALIVLFAAPAKHFRRHAPAGKLLGDPAVVGCQPGMFEGSCEMDHGALPDFSGPRPPPTSMTILPRCRAAAR